MKKVFNCANPISIEFPKLKYRCNTPVAILMATYNGEKYIKEQIESILAQTYTDWTLYIRDDGSLDETTKIIDDYVSKYPEKIIRVFTDEKNVGCSNNFYILLFSVSAKYYMFCDQDDIWMSEKVQKSLISIDSISNDDIPSLIACDSVICDANLNIIGQSIWKEKDINRYKLLKRNIVPVLCSVGGAEMIFNEAAKELLRNNIDNDFTYDHFLLINVVNYGKVRVLDDPLRLYRIHNCNVFGSDPYKNNSILQKIKNIPIKLNNYYCDYCILKEINYGSLLKYIYYKLKSFSIMKL